MSDKQGQVDRLSNQLAAEHKRLTALTFTPRSKSVYGSGSVRMTKLLIAQLEKYKRVVERLIIGLTAECKDNPYDPCDCRSRVANAEMWLNRLRQIMKEEKLT